MIPDFGKGVFICSKPLQLLACAGIARLYDVADPEVYVLTHALADADDFLDFVRASDYGKLFGAIYNVKGYDEAVERLTGAAYDSLFVEDDRVSLYHRIAPLKRRFLSLFEEGIGTYRNDYRKQLSGLRRLRWQITAAMTGCGLQFGDGRLTDYVIVQFPEAYAQLNSRNARKVLPASPIRDELAHLSRDWDETLSTSGIQWPSLDSHVAFVLGTWGGVPDDVMVEITAASDQVYYKAHPHDGIVPRAEEVEVIATSWIPAEVYIDRFAAACRSLTVYHFSSTVQLNCGDRYPNVRFVDLLSDPRFVEVMAAIMPATAPDESEMLPLRS